MFAFGDTTLISSEKLKSLRHIGSNAKGQKWCGRRLEWNLIIAGG